MSNQKKLSSLATYFIYKVSGRLWQNFAKNLIHTGRSNLPRNLDSVTGRVSDSRIS
jgi:hypothetical protein